MVKRELYMEQIRSLRDKDIIKVITGVRRCGKSYLLNLIIQELLEDGIKEENIILINLDSGDYNYIEHRNDLDELVHNLLKNKDGPVYLFFDEIQNVSNWEKSIVSYFVDYDADIYITGSNSNLLSGELSSHLTGRYMQIKVYPFSFNEFRDYKLEQSEEISNPEILEFYESKWLEEFINWGGFPFSLSLQDINKLNYLDDLLSSIIYKDLLQRYNIRDIYVLNKLIMFLLDNLGNVFSAKSISDFLKNEGISLSHVTIQNYLSFLENACIFYKVPREDIKGKGLLRVNEKYYVVDTGFISSLNGSNSLKKNRGHIIENIVFLELIKRDYAVTVGKFNELEVDFICRKHNEKFYIQVTNEIHDGNYDREFRPLLNIRDAYPKFIVSEDTNDFSVHGIKHINLLKFLKDFIY